MAKVGGQGEISVSSQVIPQDLKMLELPSSWEENLEKITH